MLLLRLPTVNGITATYQGRSKNHYISELQLLTSLVTSHCQHLTTLQGDLLLSVWRPRMTCCNVCCWLCGFAAAAAAAAVSDGTARAKMN